MDLRRAHAIRAATAPLVVAALLGLGPARPDLAVAGPATDAAGPWVHTGSLLYPGPVVPADVAGPAPIAPPPGRRDDFWVIRTAAAPQVMGSDPWPHLQAYRLDPLGLLAPAAPGTLLAQAAGRPVVIMVQGNLVSGLLAVNATLKAWQWLDGAGAIPGDALVVLFDWPSERTLLDPALDLNEKSRRAFVAGYHLARLLQAFPPGARACLIGHSEGGRVVPAALHLLGGGALNSQSLDPPIGLPGPRPPLRLRAVLISGAIDHHWLDPGRRLGRALPTSEAVLGLYNPCDAALAPYPLLPRSGHHSAMGSVGLLPRDERLLGPLRVRYAEADLHPDVGVAHSLLVALVHPPIASLIAPYTWAAPLPAARPRRAGARRRPPL
ncbi:alpha/beta hydrolase family protein [Tautonia plasticadhaerens]|uniref:Alpha/beta hydrolase family protein n=1 Tax=Tautonia plasticadhaerens TaxID=2527974 RepID=A0A518HFF4_9BACT|nr:hypothetical protein [Tautonia plasticadhaerens]QDV39577.1 hypothetical protein ElP_75480 [Tautonia plasticadhaerens]